MAKTIKKTQKKTKDMRNPAVTVDPTIEQSEDKKITVMIGGPTGIGKSTIGAILTNALDVLGFNSITHRTNTKSIDKSHIENMARTIRDIAELRIPHIVGDVPIEIIEMVSGIGHGKGAYVAWRRDGDVGIMQIQDAITHEPYAWVSMPPDMLEEFATALLNMAKDIRDKPEEVTLEKSEW